MIFQYKLQEHLNETEHSSLLNLSVLYFHIPVSRPASIAQI